MTATQHTAIYHVNDEACFMEHEGNFLCLNDESGSVEFGEIIDVVDFNTDAFERLQFDAPRDLKDAYEVRDLVCTLAAMLQQPTR